MSEDAFTDPDEEWPAEPKRLDSADPVDDFVAGLLDDVSSERGERILADVAARQHLDIGGDGTTG